MANYPQEYFNSELKIKSKSLSNKQSCCFISFSVLLRTAILVWTCNVMKYFLALLIPSTADRNIAVISLCPPEVILTQQKENGLLMWQQQWTNTGKGAVTKAFFPSVRNRIKQKIPVFPELTTMLTGHGKIRSHVYRFGLRDTAMCPCEEEEQTVDHLIFKCKKLSKNRNKMIKQINKKRQLAHE